MGLSQEFPSIDAGFAFVLQSYTWLIGRIEAADNRLNQILTLAATITSGVPAVARAIKADISFVSFYFLVALALFVVGAVWSIKARLQGAVALPDPTALYDALDEEADLFKANAIFFAGRHYRENAALVLTKSNAAAGAMSCLVGEIFALIFWMARS
jgi:hypothetical protein